MRTDQYVGLNERAKNLVARYTKVLREEFEGAFGNKFPLYDYKNDCGHVVYSEYVQAQPWSSGPMFFIALKCLMAVSNSLWNDQEIEDKT
jgi:hypothetical protein